jgi:hypothetical protein
VEVVRVEEAMLGKLSTINYSSPEWVKNRTRARCPHYKDSGLDSFTTDLGLLYSSPEWVIKPLEEGRMPFAPTHSRKKRPINY